MTRFMDVCEQAARAGGRILQEMRGQVNPREKGPKDLVTEADFASQEAIRQLLMAAFPDHRFLGEEDPQPSGTASPTTASPTTASPTTASPTTASPTTAAESSEFCWLVDPLDGTLNYTRQLPNYAVSIALRQGEHVICGVVYDPVLDECFAAELGAGATLNGRPIGTSSCQRVDQALIGASLPAGIPRGSKEIDRLVEVIHQAQAIRRLGSAALNLSYVAMGRLDAYWATCVKIWDVAAGVLIVTEAGGIVTRLDGAPFDLDRPQFVTGATPPLHAELVALLGEVDGV